MCCIKGPGRGVLMPHNLCTPCPFAEVDFYCCFWITTKSIFSSSCCYLMLLTFMSKKRIRCTVTKANIKLINDIRNGNQHQHNVKRERLAATSIRHEDSEKESISNTHWCPLHGCQRCGWIYSW